MIIQKLRQFLDENLVKYIVITIARHIRPRVSPRVRISREMSWPNSHAKKDGELCMAVLLHQNK